MTTIKKQVNVFNLNIISDSEVGEEYFESIKGYFKHAFQLGTDDTLYFSIATGKINVIVPTVPAICQECKWMKNYECHHEGGNYGTDWSLDKDHCFEEKVVIEEEKKTPI